jgi:hypothetical protein
MFSKALDFLLFSSCVFLLSLDNHIMDMINCKLFFHQISRLSLINFISTIKCQLWHIIVVLAT